MGVGGGIANKQLGLHVWVPPGLRSMQRHIGHFYYALICYPSWVVCVRVCLEGCLDALYQAHLVSGCQTHCVNYQIVLLIAPFFFTHYLSNCLPGDAEGKSGLTRLRSEKHGFNFI